MSLETRGTRPEPHSRGPVARYIYTDLDRRYRKRLHWEEPMIFHELWWGVPCGPTLSMVNPPVLRGIVVQP